MGRENMGMVMIRFPDLAAASETLADQVAGRLNEVLARQERASLALPGGTTPGLFLQALGKRPVDWHRVTVLPGDERFVPPDDPRSNERQIRALFGPARDGLCEVLSLRGEAEAVEVAAREASARLAMLMPTDVAVFGMGADGHIASLFPGEAAASWIGERHEPIIPTVAADGSRRLSLSPSAILATRFVMLLVAGEEKRDAIKTASRDGALETLPVRLLLRRDVTVFSAE